MANGTATSSLQRVLAEQRAELRTIQAQMIRNASVSRSLLAQLRATTLDIVRRLRTGGAMAGMDLETLRAMVDDQQLFAALQQQARVANSQILSTIMVEVARAQTQIAAIAVRHAEIMLERQGIDTFALRMVPVRALSEIVGLMGQSSPFRGLRDLSAVQIDSLGDTLARGIAQGYHPLRIARDIVDQGIGVPEARAATIARTEVMRAYRGSSGAFGAANSVANGGPVTGWVWQTSGGSACAACLAMEGSEHSPDEEMDSHVNCQCIQVWTTVGWDGTVDGEGATDAESLGIESGEDTFAAMTPDEQRAILGPGKYELYQRGKIKLVDVVHVRRSAEWGGSVGVASQRQALANAAARRAA